VVGERYLVSRMERRRCAGAATAGAVLSRIRWTSPGRSRASCRDAEFGPATPLFTISTEARAAIHSVVGFDVSADGQRFVIPIVTSAEGPSIVVVQNWEALLPHKP
jgi:hypothetical protein